MSAPQRPIKRQQLGEVVADELRREILSGRLAGGVELRQEELAERFGTSRIPVRDAVQSLERDGLLIVHGNRRATVAPLEEVDILDHYRVRGLIESEAAAACVLERVDVKPLIDIQNQLAEAAADQDRRRYEELNRDFHAWIWHSSGSRWLERLAQNLWQGMGPYTPGLVPEQLVRALPEHESIILAIESGDERRAREAMRQHIVRSGESLLAYRRKQLMDPSESASR